MPQISVIMPAYNGISTIRKAVESVLAQSISDFEFLIIDDQSTDGTWELLKQLEKTDKRIQVFRTPESSGPSVARQIALEIATGEWVTLIDADDWYLPNRLEKMVEAARSLQADMVIDNLLIYDHALGKIVKQTHYISRSRPSILSMEDVFRLDSPLRRDSIGYCKPMTKLSFMRDKNVHYWGRFRSNEDFLILAEAIISGAKAFVIPEAYYVYMHRISPSARTVSPTSHSASDSALVVIETSDAIVRKYPTLLTNSIRKQMERRKEIFLTSRIAGEQTLLVRQGKYGAALMLLITHPALWSFRATGMCNRLRRKLGLAV